MSDILTDADLAEIEKRAEAATQGPWDSPPWVDTLDRWTIHTVRGERDGAVGYLPSFATANSEADRTFIAASRTDIPALLATIRSDRKEIARLRGIEERAKTMLAAYRAEGGCADQIGVLAELLEGDDDPDVLGNAADTL
jgi:hypothetical protein